MNPTVSLAVMLGYFGVLYAVAHLTTRHADGEDFYVAGRKSSWLLVSYGSVAISGISFISVPGEVARSQFSYMQIVLGYGLGYLVIAFALLPLYYRENSPSIYAFLADRYGGWTHRTGVVIFLVAHLMGAALRLGLMAGVVQYLVFDAFGLPFWFTVLLTVALIWAYTFRAGTKTLVVTDSLQTTVILVAVVASVFAIAGRMNASVVDLGARMADAGVMRVFNWTWGSPANFFKQVAAGTLLTLMTTGLDQALMQKHLSCPDLRSAQKNICLLAGNFLLTNLVFLFLGGALVLFALERGIAVPARTDELYPLLASTHLGTLAGILFVLGIAAAAYNSADTSLTGLTTAFCVDLLGYERQRPNNSAVRTGVHLGFAVVLWLVILVFKGATAQSVVQTFIRMSGYVYGPMLGLYGFGLLTRRTVPDRIIPFLCAAAPAAALTLDAFGPRWFGYTFGHEIMVVNAATMLGLLFLLSKRNASASAAAS
jgi:SSS family solute:Na+ symporter